LKSCEAYRNRDPQSQPDSVEVKAEPTGRPAYKAIEPKAMPKAESYAPASHVRRQIVVEKPETIASAFPPDEIPPAEQAEVGEGSRNLLIRSALEDAKEAQRLERIKHARIETGKRFAEEMLKGTLFLNPWDRYTATREVEVALNRELTGEDSPADAERIVDGVLARWLEQEERYKREKRQQEAEERRCERKRELIEYGETYAREAAAEEGLSPMGKITFYGNVRRELEKELDGSETEEDVEDLVEEILNELLEEEE
jgi:hypothetical protein